MATLKRITLLPEEKGADFWICTDMTDDVNLIHDCYLLCEHRGNYLMAATIQTNEKLAIVSFLMLAAICISQSSGTGRWHFER
jgi:hypothetical protein